jgi:hypothetical protein
MVLEVMIENNQSRTPKVSELEDWADNYGLTMPVLADADLQMWNYADGMSQVGLPFTVVLDRGVVIDTTTSGANDSRAVKLLK